MVFNKLIYSPRGYYFVSSSMDHTALLWNVEYETPLRAFVGHYSDVFVILFFKLCSVFHPNSNYIATGSTDRSVRIWDVTSGSSVRLFTGFKVLVLFIGGNSEFALFA